MRNLALTTCALLTIALPAAAQETKKYTFDAGAGFTTAVGNTGRYLDNPGWNIRGGAGYNLSSRFGVKLDLGFDSFGASNAALPNITFDSGNVHMFTATVNPVVHLTPKGRFDFYVIGGGGLFHQSQNFSSVSALAGAPASGFFSGSAGAFPAGFYSVTKPGYDAGAGVALGSKWHGKFFAEARYYHMFNRDTPTDFVPVTFGFRW